ncbi:MAG: PHP domain-containing protein [gamma proteobacterium symbiont of Bathyaustriella thionipta]|nr:PHP domain-containing protein [gamma proteobacterium symbiont of Bathyaustriella thionipta]
MNCYVDLHSHSSASDGSLSPQQLVTQAARAGVKTLALTDHDTLSGLAQAQLAAQQVGMQLVNGVEISVSWNKRTVHIVGLNVDPANEMLQKGLQGLRDFREWRAQEIARRLQKKGIEGALEGASAYATGDLISRTHFARFLVEKAYAKSMRDVFRHYLVVNKPGHVAGDWTTLEECVSWVKAAGGQAVVAHPARYRLTRSKLLRLLREFHEMGGAAMEVVSGSHSRDEIFTMARHAADCSLLASAGSDYHGPENPWVKLGKLPPLPENCTPIWHDWALAA